MSSNRVTQASLILDDGTVYKGKLFGASECVAGEVGKVIKVFWGFVRSFVRSLTFDTWFLHRTIVVFTSEMPI